MPRLHALVLIGALSLASTSIVLAKNEDPFAQIKFKARSSLSIAIPDDIKTTDPVLAEDALTVEVLSHVHETLYQYPYTLSSASPEPWLAADLPTLNADSGKLTIPIRTDLKYAEGSTIAAEDFALAIKRTQLPSAPEAQKKWLQLLIVGLAELESRLAEAPAKERKKILLAPVTGVQTPSPQLLVLQLKPMGENGRFYSRSSTLFTDLWSAPVQESALNDEGMLKQELRYGAGAYRIASRSLGKSLRLDRNTFYAKQFYPARSDKEFKDVGLAADAGKPLPQIDRLDLRITRRPTEAFMLFKSGEVGATPVSQDLMKTADGDPKLKNALVRKPSEQGLEYFFFNSKNPLLKTLTERAPYCKVLSSPSFKLKWIAAGSKSQSQAAGSLVPSEILPESASPVSFDQASHFQSTSPSKKVNALQAFELPIILRSRGFRSMDQAKLLTQELSPLGAPARAEENDYLDWKDKFDRKGFGISQYIQQNLHPWPEHWISPWLVLDLETSEPILTSLAAGSDAKEFRALLDRWNSSLLRNCHAVPISENSIFTLVNANVRNVHRNTRSYARGPWKYWRL
jgi:hypothetical protein